MKTRAYEFVTGIEASTQPDAGTPTASNDLVTLGYFNTLGLGTPFQALLTGTYSSPNTTYTLPHDPIIDAGLIAILGSTPQEQGVNYTISGTTITFANEDTSDQKLFVYGRY